MTWHRLVLIVLFIAAPPHGSSSSTMLKRKTSLVATRLGDAPKRTRRASRTLSQRAEPASAPVKEAQEVEPANWFCLATELKHRVFSFLNSIDKLVLRAVSKEFHYELDELFYEIDVRNWQVHIIRSGSETLLKWFHLNNQKVRRQLELERRGIPPPANWQLEHSLGISSIITHMIHMLQADKLQFRPWIQRLFPYVRNSTTLHYVAESVRSLEALQFCLQPELLALIPKQRKWRRRLWVGATKARTEGEAILMMQLLRDQLIPYKCRAGSAVLNAGRVQVYRWLVQHGYRIANDRTMCGVIHPSLIRELYLSGFHGLLKLPDDFIHLGCDLDTLELLKNDYPEFFIPDQDDLQDEAPCDTVKLMLQTGNIPMLQWAIKKHELYMGDIERLLETDIGNFEAFRWLVEHYEPPGSGVRVFRRDPRVSRMVAAEGNLAWLQYIHSIGFPLDSSNLLMVVQRLMANEDQANLVLRHDKFGDAYLRDNGVYYGQLNHIERTYGATVVPILDWLASIQSPMILPAESEYLLILLIEKACIAGLLWMKRNNRLPPMTTSVMRNMLKTIVRRNATHVLEALVLEGIFKPTPGCMYSVIRVDNLDMVRLLYRLGCGWNHDYVRELLSDLRHLVSDELTEWFAKHTSPVRVKVQKEDLDDNSDD